MTGAAWRRHLRATAQRHGATLERTRKGHYAIRLPNGAQVFAPGTPGDWRCARNLDADITRALRGRVRQ